MTKLQTEKYLRKVIKHAKVLHDMSSGFGKDISLCSYFSTGIDDKFSIQIYRGVRFISKTLGLPLHEDKGKFEDRNYLSVVFDGCIIFELEDR